MKNRLMKGVTLCLAAGALSACGVADTGTAAATNAAAKAREAAQARQTIEDVKAQVHSAEALQRDRDKALEAVRR